MTDALARLRRAAEADLPVHGGRTLAYVYDSGLPEHRPDRPRGGRGVRRRRTGWTRPRSRACCGWRTTWSGSRSGCSTARTPRSAPSPRGGTESVPARRPGRRATRTRASPSRGWCSRAPRTRRSTRPRTTSGSSRCSCRSGPASPPTWRRPRQRSTRRPTGRCWWWPARRRTRTASSTRSPSSPRSAAAARASGATSTPASAAGCSRTPRGSADPCPRGRSRCRASPRSRSTCTSTATHPRAPRCCCTATRSSGGRSSSRRAAWPGYTMLNSTMQSTKSGGPLAGAWAVVESLGDTGYELLSREVFEAVDAIVAGTADIDGVDVLVPPQSTLIALVTDGSCDAFTVCDEMAARGWYVQPQMSYAGTPPTIHLSVSAATGAHVPEFLQALRDSVTAAQQAGPVAVDPGVVAFIEALDPDRPHRRRLRRPARCLGPGRRVGGRLSRPAGPDGRRQRAPRPGLARTPRGPAGGLPGSAVATDSAVTGS